MATVAVFGGAGFIGRHVVQRLAAAGHQVRVAGRFAGDARALLPGGDPAQIVPYVADITDPAAVRAVVDGADYAINLVGILVEARKGQFQALQRDGAFNIAQACTAAGVRRLVHVSAIGADVTSDSRYAESKGAGELAVLGAFSAAAVLRPSIVFGPEDNFFNMFARMARFSPFLPLIGGGRTRFQPVYVGDVADAVMAALTRPEACGRIYELGGPQVWCFAELLRFVLRVTGRRRLLLPVPFGLARLQAWFLEFLPTPPLTRDQVRLLARDNVVTGAYAGLAELGIAAPKSVGVIVPRYLQR